MHDGDQRIKDYFRVIMIVARLPSGRRLANVQYETTSIL
jgi:hypothetical protein